MLDVVVMPLQNVDNAIVFSVMQGLAVLLTLFRLGFRLRIQRFWWEDAWAAVAAVCAVIFIATTPAFFIYHRYDLVLITGWINACMFTGVVWSVRMSLVCSILRITTSLCLRRLSLAAASLMFLFCAATFALETWWCKITTTIYGRTRSSCMLPNFIVIFEVATNCLADLFTLVLSLKLLWRVGLPPRQRRMILGLFTASRFLCMFALPRSISQLVASRRVQNILANIELIAFVIVCNLIVVVTYVYRFFLRSSPAEFDSDVDEDFTTAPRVTYSLTTVDLGDLDMACASDARSITDFTSSCFDSSTPSTQ